MDTSECMIRFKEVLSGKLISDVCVQLHSCVHICTCVCVVVCICTGMHVCMCVCVSVSAKSQHKVFLSISHDPKC